MKVLLISPPHTLVSEDIMGYKVPPLNLSYLASVIRKKHKVKIIDAPTQQNGLKKIEQKLKKFFPDIVGITSTTPSIYSAYTLAKISKKIKKDTTVVIGGPHSSFLSQEVLKECRSLDIVVKGEGEKTFKKLLNILEKEEPLKKVKGITYRENNEINENPERPLIKNIDNIPFPSRDLLPINKYQTQGKNIHPCLQVEDVHFIALTAPQANYSDTNGEKELQKTF